MLNNHTWVLVSLLKGRKLVHCKWVCITKYVANGFVDKNKAYLVENRFLKVEGIDNYKTLTLV